MSNYVVTTDFAAKDNLASGNPLKKIKGADFTTEFNNIATAVNSKADTASPALTGTPTAPTAPADTNTTQIATTAYVQTELLDLNASNLTSGTVPDARFPATLPAVSGANLTNLNASNLASGTVPTARLGGGTANSSVFLRGDGQWAATLGAALTVNGYVYSSQNTYAGFTWHVPDAGTNNKRTLFFAHNGGLVFNLYDDSFTSAQTAFDISRSGTTPTAFTTYCVTRTQPASVSFSTTPTFNAQSSNVFYFGAMTGNVTSVTISNPTDGQTIQIRFVQDGTGGRTVTLPGSVVVSGSINTAANAVTWLVITYVASAARWEGTWTRIS